MLLLVVCALVVSAALPVRGFFAQRGEIDRLRAEQAQATARVVALEAERTRLQDPAYRTAEARRRLQYVMPGETAYVLIDDVTPQPAQGDRSDEPWYSQLWGTVEDADRP